MLRQITRVGAALVTALTLGGGGLATAQHVHGGVAVGRGPAVGAHVGVSRGVAVSPHVGGYYGGYRPGGYAGYAYRPGYSTAYYRGYTGYYGYRSPYYGYRYPYSGVGVGVALGGLGYGRGYYPGYVYGYGVPSYSAYVPSYSSYYDTTNYYVPSYSSVTVGTGVDVPPPGYDSAYPPPAGPEQAPAPNTAPVAGSARVTVQVPASATLWIDGQVTQQTGAVRQFVTPANLEPGRRYSYRLQAQWTENGQTVTREKTVEFAAGNEVIVNLRDPNP